MTDSDKKANHKPLRQKAGELQKQQASPADSERTDADNLKLIHELEVHQIELELQNEELQISKNAEHEASEKYTDLYDFAPTGYFTLSPGGNIIELNFTAAKMLGKERSLLINSQFGFFLSNGSKPIFNHFLGKVFQNPSIESCEISLSKNNPEYLYLSGKADATNDKCFINAVDITEKKLAEKKLAKSKKRFEELIDLLPEAVVELDLNLNLTYLNQRTINLIGYSEEDIASGLNALEMIVPEEREKAKNKFAQRLKGTDPGTTEYKALKKDGTTFPILFHANTIVEEDKLVGARGVIVDITERKKTERELQKSEEKFKSIFNDSAVGMSITQTDGSLSVNKAFSQLVGYSEEELNQMKWQEFTHPEDVERNREIVRLILAGKNKTARWEKRYIHKKGHIVWVDISTSLLRDDEGQPLFFITSAIDITEQKKTELELREYKELFSLFMEHSPVYTFIKEVAPTESKVLQASNNFKEMVGIAGPEMIGKTMEELFPSEFAAKLAADDWKAAQENKVLQVDEQLNDRHYKTIKFPINKGDKKLLAGYTIDITDHYKANEALKYEQNRLRTLIDNLPDAIYVADKLGRKMIANPADVKNIGASSESEVLWKTDLELFPGEVGLRCYNESMDVIQSGKALINKEEYFLKDGVKNWMLTTKIPLLDEQQKIIGLVGIGHDITERKKTEQELLQTKEKAEAAEIQLLTILENSPTGFAINKISTGEVSYVNKAFAEIYHIPPELCQHVDTFFEYVYGDQMELGNSILDDLRSNDPERMKWEMVPVTDKTTKKVHYVSAANIILKDLGLMISSVWDITNQVESEKKLIAALDNAKESDRLKSAFLANMSHEIRTPMNGILGFTDLLKDPHLSGEAQNQYINIIEKSGLRMLNIINDIIDISKIESGQMTLLVTDVNINELVYDIFNFFKPEAGKKALKFLCKNTPSKDEVIIQTDKVKINAILTNLVKNALKFTQKGSIELGYGIKDKFIEFFVKDTGPGIPDEQKEFIFERFRQGSESLTRKYEGAGLGLAISKAYVEMLGGKIWIESKNEQGSTFRFTVPNTIGYQENKPLPVPEKEVINHGRKLKILLVEDDETSRTLLEINTKPFASALFKAISGKEAIEICRNQPDIHLVLMDINMSEMDGYEATRQIRKFNKDVVIIAQTAYALPGDRDKAIKAGCNDYITKPIDAMALIKMIEKHLRTANV